MIFSNSRIESHHPPLRDVRNGIREGQSGPAAPGDNSRGLSEIAGIRLRQPQSEATFAALLPIIEVLLEMRRANLFTAIWVDDLKLRIQFAGSRERNIVSWKTAERLAATFSQRKERDK